MTEESGCMVVQNPLQHSHFSSDSWILQTKHARYRFQVVHAARSECQFGDSKFGKTGNLFDFNATPA